MELLLFTKKYISFTIKEQDNIIYVVLTILLGGNTMKKLIALLLAFVMMLSMVACNQTQPNQTNEGTEPNKNNEQNTTVPTEKKDPVTLTMYPLNANMTSGKIEGWLGDFLLENYNVILDVWAYSEEKANAIIAGGELPDIMYFNSQTDFKALADSGLLLDMDDYLDKMPHLSENATITPALEYVRQYVTDGTLCFLPLVVGTTANAADVDRQAVKLNWDVYEKIGAPEIKDLDQLVDVLKKMKEAQPTAPDGSPMYAMHLFNNMDSTYFYAMYSWLCINGSWHGEIGKFLIPDCETGVWNYMLDDDSLYYQGLKFFNTLYREDLLDPDSITTERTAQHKKIEAGGALAGWAAVPGYEENGYYAVSIKDVKTAYATENVYGNGNYIGVSAKTEHLDEVLSIIDMLADPEALTTFMNGPQGELWDLDADGNAYMTEKGIALWVNGQTAVLASGETYSPVNTGAILAPAEESAYNNTLALATSKKCVELQSQTEASAVWRETNNANNYMEVLVRNDGLLDPFYLNTYMFAANPTDEQSLIIDEAKNIIVQASWKMVYAESDAEFDQIWDKAVKDCEELGIKAIADWRRNELVNAKKLIESME